MLAAIWVSVAIISLATIDIGNLFYQRRDLQRIADLAALAAVQSMDPTDTTCGGSANAAKPNATSVALSNAQKNDSNTVSTSAPVAGSDQLSLTCGRWDASGTGVTYTPATAGTTQLNATRVTMTRAMRYFFLGDFSWLGAGPATVSASSTARASQIDTFSVSGTLLNLNPTWLNAILSKLLGANVNLTLADYQSLAGASIKLGDLATAFGVGSVNGLITMGATDTATLAGKLNTYVGVVKPGTDSSGISHSSGYVAQLQAASSTLGKLVGFGLAKQSLSLASSSASSASALKIGLGNPQAGANSTINLFDLLLTSAEVANGTNGIALSGTLPLGTLTQGTLTQCPSGSCAISATNVQLQILSPPSIAIGEAGLLPDGVTWRTQASSAEIGLFLDVVTPTLNVSILGLVGAQLSGVSLPLYLVAGGPANAWLAATNCQASAAQSTITIGAQPHIARLCASSPPGGTLNLNNTSSCPAASGTLQIATLSATLVGLPLASVPISATVANPLLQIGSSDTQKYYSAPYTEPSTLTGNAYPANTPYQFCNDTVNYPSPAVCPDGWSSNPYWTTYNNNLGSQLGKAVTNLNLQQLNVSVTTILGVTIPLTIPVATLTTILGDILTPILSSLDTLIVPLLNTLGVQVGQATVHQISLTCNAAQLVNN